MIKAFSHEQLYKLIKSGSPSFLVDVRDLDYGFGGIIKGSIHVPSFDFSPERVAELVKMCGLRQARDIICYCSFGKARSVQSAMIVCDYLEKNKESGRFGVGYLKGGFKMFRAWYDATDVIVPESEILKVN